LRQSLWTERTNGKPQLTGGCRSRDVQAAKGLTALSRHRSSSNGIEHSKRGVKCLAHQKLLSAKHSFDWSCCAAPTAVMPWRQGEGNVEEQHW